MTTVLARCRIGLVVVLVLAACSEDRRQTAALHRAPPIPNEVDGVIFEAGNWDPHLVAGEEIRVVLE